MPWGAIAAVAGSVLSGAMQSDAIGSASESQERGTAASIAEQRRQFDLSRGDLRTANEQTRADLTPYRQAGTAGINRLSQLMGLKRDPGSFQSSINRENFKTGSTRGLVPGTSVSPDNGDWQRREDWLRQENAQQGMPFTPSPGFNGYPKPENLGSGQQFTDTPTYDEAGYNNALSGERAAWDSSNAASEGSPDFNSLNAPIAAAKKFTLADFWDDPVTKASYQAGLDQGTKALTNMAGARGNLNSGGTLKALERFGIDYTGGQAAGSEGRFVRNENDIYGREVARRDTQFNRLSGITGTGQTATNSAVAGNTGTANTIALMGANSANNVSNLMSSQGNARGAAAIAGGQVWGGAAQNAGNAVSNWWNRKQAPAAGAQGWAGVPAQYDMGYGGT